MKAEEHPLSQKPLIRSEFFISGDSIMKNNEMSSTHLATIHNDAESKDLAWILVQNANGLLKAEQELEKKKEEHFNSLVYISNQGLKISELEETLEAFKSGILRADSLMEVFGEDIELKELAKAAKKIGELEETISAKDAKLEAILKGLREADDALSFANEHARAKQIIRDLLKEHKS